MRGLGTTRGTKIQWDNNMEEEKLERNHPRLFLVFLRKKNEF